jgi:hypothetical protein
MPVKPNKRLELIRRRQQIAELYLQSWTQVAIAGRLGISQSIVSDDLKRIRQEWRASTIRDFDLAQIEELQKIDRIEREAWSAWAQSQKPAQSAVINGDGGDRPTRKSIRNQHGDARLLEVILKCNAARRTMLALDPPMRIAPVMPDGREPFRLAVASLGIAELRALKRVRERVLAVSDQRRNDDDDAKNEGI